MEELYAAIKKDRLIWKFCFYGLLKNLEFFEPYLLIYLLSLGMNLFKIGILISIREIVTYIFEVPSGIFADNYGKKKELMICFTFYMVSFALFFFGSSFYILAAAMVFYGLGEAFRSGTHKAIIYAYLEQKNWFKHKAFVYGRTRSFSLIGSSVSAFLSIVFVLNLPGVKWIFLISILPFLADFILIWTYPNSLDERRVSELSFKRFLTDSVIQIKKIFKNTVLTKVLVSSSLFDGVFKTVKDYIQPILQGVILLTAASSFSSFSSDSKVKIYLGIIYGVFYIFSSAASRNVYRLNKYASSDRLMKTSFDILGVLSILLFAVIYDNLTAAVVIVFFFIYILKDGRRTIVVDVCGDHMNKNERATVMSVDSQLKSLFTVILAPLFGFIADRFSIGILFLVIGILLILTNRFLALPGHPTYVPEAEIK